MATSTIKADVYYDSYTSQYTNKASKLYYRNGIATLYIRELKNIPAGQTLLFTMPTKYVNTQLYTYYDTYSNGATWRFIIAPNGAVYVYNYGSAISGTDNSNFLITYVTY